MDGGREGGREGGSEIDHDQRQGLLARARMSGHILTSAKVRASMRAQEGIGCVQCVRVCACVCVCARALSVSPLFVCLCSLSLSVSLSLSLSLARALSLSRCWCVTWWRGANAAHERRERPETWGK